jgi:predicted transcriptional regulator
MTIYRAELTHLELEGKTPKDVAKMLAVEKETVDDWYDGKSQPKDEIMVILEAMFFKREEDMLRKESNPEMVKKRKQKSKKD